MHGASILALADIFFLVITFFLFSQRLNKNKDDQNGVVFSMADTDSDISSKVQINWGYQTDKVTSDSDSDSYEVVTVASNQGEVGKSSYRSGTHSIILDVSVTSSLDTVVVKTLKNVRLYLNFLVS